MNLRHFEQYNFRGEPLYILPKPRNGLEKGTVYFRGELIRGFPKIKRILMLKNGIKKYFDGTFGVEEKIDGYNVRMCAVSGEVLVFTRGGFICPFTLSRVREDENVCDFLMSNPDLVLCVEMAGLRNPYVPKDYPVEDIGFFAFDIRRKETNEPLPLLERRKLLSEWDIPQVELLGEFSPSDGEKVMEVVERLNCEGREGIVMKSLDMRVQLKYTTHTTNVENVEYAFRYPFDFGRDFIFSRLIREGF